MYAIRSYYEESRRRASRRGVPALFPLRGALLCLVRAGSGSSRSPAVRVGQGADLKAGIRTKAARCAGGVREETQGGIGREDVRLNERAAADRPGVGKEPHLIQTGSAYDEVAIHQDRSNPVCRHRDCRDGVPVPP